MGVDRLTARCKRRVDLDLAARAVGAVPDDLTQQLVPPVADQFLVTECRYLYAPLFKQSGLLLRRCMAAGVIATSLVL